MFDYYFKDLNTKSLTYSNELGIKKNNTFKNILSLNGQAFLLFSNLDFSDFINFKEYFKKFGSLYLQGFIEYIPNKLFPFPKSELDADKEFGTYISIRENISSTRKLDLDFKKAKVIYGETVLKENGYDVIIPILKNLDDNLKQYLNNNKPIDIINIENLHSFIYPKEKKYYYYNDYSLYFERKTIITDLQDELNIYKELFKKIPLPDDFTLFDEQTLTSYLRKFIISGYIENCELKIDYKIENSNLQDLLNLELIYYLLSKNKLSECSNCGKPIIVNKKQMRFYENNKPIYCSNYCQEDSKNMRGNEKKRLKRISEGN